MFLPTAKRKATGDRQQSDPLVTETNSATARKSNVAITLISAKLHVVKWLRQILTSLKSLQLQPSRIATVIYTPISESYCKSVACTLPVTSCECERSASALRRLHNYTRASMGMSRLSSLALLHIHYDMHVDLDEVVTRYAHLHPRKLEHDSIIRNEIEH